MIVDYKVLGQRIARRRKVLDLTQEAVAEKIGMTPSHIKSIERAYTKCSIETMCKLCQALEVTPDYLFIGTLKPADDDLVAEVVASLQLCDKRQLKMIAALINVVVEEGVT